MKVSAKEIRAIVAALVEGAEYYSVSYPTGVTLEGVSGSFFLYDKDNRILTSNNDKAALAKALERAKDRARIEIERADH